MDTKLENPNCIHLMTVNIPTATTEVSSRSTAGVSFPAAAVPVANDPDHRVSHTAVVVSSTLGTVVPPVTPCD